MGNVFLVVGEDIIEEDLWDVIIVAIIDPGLGEDGDIVLVEVVFGLEEVVLAGDREQVWLDFLVVFGAAVFVHPIMICGPHFIPHPYYY